MIGRLVLLGLLVSVSAAASTFKEGCVLYENQQLWYRPGPFNAGNPNIVAYGSFNDSLDTSGWGVLDVKGVEFGGWPSTIMMRAAGMVEGALTADRIYQMSENLWQIFFAKKEPSAKLKSWVKKQHEFVEAQVKAQSSTSRYWKGVGLIQEQLKGLQMGYELGGTNKLDLFHFQMLQDCGDLLDLIKAVDVEERIEWHKMEKEEFFQVKARNGHCSSLIKPTYDLSEIFFGHSSWFEYIATGRIFKHYSFETVDFPGTSMSFSSYPGFLVSLDAFWQLGQGLAMVQTTNNVFNNTLYEQVKPESLMAWQRVRVANLMAFTAEEWAQVFAQYNSGTYNNNYAVLDLNQFEPGQPLKNGTLWHVEQIPGLVESADVTPYLAKGYWASYNVPFFPKIYKMSGSEALEKKFGPDLSYDMAPRAQIFRRDQDGVKDMDSFKAILRYNDYLNDPIANGDPMKAICSRGDLQAGSSAAPFGCYDTKVSSSRHMGQFQRESFAVNGPTQSHGLPAFKWAQFPTNKHFDLPPVYNFPFVSMSPRNFGDSTSNK